MANETMLSPGQIAAGKAGLSVVYFVGGLIGAGGNAALAATILRNKYLQSSASFLLAALAISDGSMGAINVGAGITYVVQLATGLQDLPIRLCFFALEAPRMYFLFGSVVLILGCALDRLLMMRVPMRYAHFRRWRYVGGWVLASQAFAGASILLLYAHLEAEFKMLPLCENAFLFDPRLQLWLTAFHLPLSLLIIGISFYSIHFIAEVQQVEGESETRRQRRERFQRSMLVVVRVYIQSWLLMVCMTTLEILIIPLTPEHPIYPIHVVVIILGIFLYSINYSANFFIYYTRNGDYRKELRLLLGLSSESTSFSARVSSQQPNSTV